MLSYLFHNQLIVLYFITCFATVQRYRGKTFFQKGPLLSFEIGRFRMRFSCLGTLSRLVFIGTKIVRRYSNYVLQKPENLFPDTFYVKYKGRVRFSMNYYIKKVRVLYSYVELFFHTWKKRNFRPEITIFWWNRELAGNFLQIA